MSEIPIKIKIAERIYPMRVQQADEAKIREASKNINDRITQYMNKFGISDKQDLLAMVAFDCLVQNSTDDVHQPNLNLTNRINYLCEKISNIID